MGSARDFHLPPHLAAINRFTSDGVRIALRLKIAPESKHSGVAFDSTDIPVCARRRRPPRSQRRIRPAIQITLAYFGNANRAYQHASARHLVAENLLSVPAARRLPFPVAFSPEVAMAPPLIDRLGLAPGPQLSALVPCLTI